MSTFDPHADTPSTRHPDSAARAPDVVLPSADELSQLEREEDELHPDNDLPFRPVVAFLWAGGAGLVGAVLWAAITAATDYELGIVAIGLGFLVGKGAAKGGRGKSAQILGAGMAAGSFFFAKFLTVIFMLIADPTLGGGSADEPAAVASANDPGVDAPVAVADGSTPNGPATEPTVSLGEVFSALLVAILQDTFTSLSAVFFGIAVWEGYRIPQRA